MDLLERRLKVHSDRIKSRAEEALKRTKAHELRNYSVDFDKELAKFKLKVLFFSYSMHGTLVDMIRCLRA